MAKTKTPAPVATEAETPEPEAVVAIRTTRARVLVDVTVDGKLCRSGSLLEADADVIESLGAQVDTHPDAVAYCEKGD